MKRLPILRLILALLLWASVSLTFAAVPSGVKTSTEPRTRSQQLVDSLMKASLMQGSAFGLLAIRVGGDTIAAVNPQMKLIPASNTKLITTGLALNELGADFQFKTSLGYSGSIENGTLKGDLYIIGGGDPTLGSKDSIVPTTEALFSQWKGFLTAAGIQRIEGKIIGDGSYFEGPIEEPSWQYEDLGTYYGAGGDGLCFYRNIQEFRVTPGSKVGEPLSVYPLYPSTPWMKFSYDCTTGAAGTGDELYLYGTEFAPVAELRGTFALDRKTKDVQCSNKFGALTCAYYFHNYLKNNGIISGGYGDSHVAALLGVTPAQSESSSSLLGVTPAQSPSSSSILGVTDAQSESSSVIPSPFSSVILSEAKNLKRDNANLTIIGSTTSPPLRKIAYITNQRSDNFYAEALYRIVGKRITGSARYPDCALAQKEAFKRLGVDASKGARLVDGSGLSKKDFVSPEFLCSFLRAMMGSSCFDTYVSTLTIPGIGHQVGRMKSEPQALRERIFYKSGSMDGVRCFSGYIIPKDGTKEDTIIFSVMLNNCTAPSWKMMLTLDKIIATLAKE